MIQTLIAKAVAGDDLTVAEAASAIRHIMSGEATPAQIAAFVIALRTKGETVDEVVGAAQTMRALATAVPHSRPLVADTAGTGGGRTQTFNISTTAAFVIAAAGLPVAKHGNRSYTSRSGSACVLEALGANLDVSPEQAGRAIDEVGLGFLFAPMLHGAMRHAAPVRREIGVHTIFNYLGPLTNPAGAHVQLIGVFAPELVPKLAAALAALGTEAALVVHGDGGIDELSISGPSRVAEVRDGRVRQFEVTPEQAGLARQSLDALRSGSPAENAAVARSVLAGDPGPARDIVLLNAAAPLYLGGLAADLREGVALAAQAIDSGAALAKLEQFCAFTKTMSEVAS